MDKLRSFCKDQKGFKWRINGNTTLDLNLYININQKWLATLEIVRDLN